MEFFSFLWMYIHRMSSEFILKALESITTEYSIIIKNKENKYCKKTLHKIYDGFKARLNDAFMNRPLTNYNNIYTLFH